MVIQLNESWKIILAIQLYRYVVLFAVQAILRDLSNT